MQAHKNFVNGRFVEGGKGDKLWSQCPRGVRSEEMQIALTDSCRRALWLLFMVPDTLN
jgi:hypothetical protein